MSIATSESSERGSPLSGRRQYQRAAAADEFRQTLAALGLTRTELAQLLGYAPRTIRHWAAGSRSVSHETTVLLRLARAGRISLADIEEAAAPVRAENGSATRGAQGTTNGLARPESVVAPTVNPEPGPLKHDPLPAGSDLTTAEKVLALTPGACRWPIGDPQDPDFRFCGGKALQGEVYCSTHRDVATKVQQSPKSRRGGRSRGCIAQAHVVRDSDHFAGVEDARGR
jgi:GcrA cell cycle regulator